MQLNMGMQSNLQKRLCVASILIPITLVCLFWAPLFVNQLLALLLSLLMGHEWSRMTKAPYGVFSSSFLTTILFALTFASQTFLSPLSIFLHKGLAYILLLAPFLFAYSRKYRLFVMGYFYITGAMLFLGTQIMRPHLVLWMLLLIWSNDSFAYFIGKNLKGPKLWVRVSPNKTWSGFVGGIFCGATVGGCIADFYDIVPHPYTLSILLSFMGHGGDLLESFAKRYYNVKDSGTLLPGHGGFLDRLDSLLAVLWGYGIFYVIQHYLT